MAVSPQPGEASAIGSGAQGLETRRMLRKLESSLFGASEVQAPTLGRFTIIGRLGEGGMGTVFAAYDPHLDRKVALKVLRPQTEDDTPESHARLLREAQSLAKLAHPNVVSIYEVGMVGERVFLALEYVAGGDLARAVSAGNASLDERLDWLTQAGRGLVAAHARGLIHRDVKPANILIDADGRAKMSDFGLATDPRAPDAESLNDSFADHAVGSARASSQPGLGPRMDEALRTKTGARIGTLAFMAPEQIDGGLVDARSDQFAFCVTVYRVLEGRPPFTGRTVMALRESIHEGPEPAKLMPGWLWRLVERGLAEEAPARHPSLEALLEAIARGRRPSRWRRWTPAGLVLAVAGVTGAVAWPQVEDRCRGLAVALQGHWNDAQRNATQAAFAATERPYAAAAWEQTRAAVDDYALAWQSQATESCRSTFYDGAQSDEAHDLRMMCLGAARLEFEALTALLPEADAKLVGRADRIAHALPELTECQDVESLRAVGQPPQDPAVRRNVDDARLQIARTRTFIAAGRYDDAVQTAEAAAHSAEASGWEPVMAEALLLYGKTTQEQGQLPEAEALLRRAIDLAEANRSDKVLADAWTELLSNVADFQQRAADLDEIARRAEASVRRLGNPPLLRVRMLATRGRAQEVAGDLPGALASLEAAVALALATEDFPVDALVISQHLLANTRSMAGDPEGAVELRLSTLALAKATLGAQHPRVATILAQLAVDYMELPDNDKALATFDESMVLRQTLGLPPSADAHGNRGILLVNMARAAESLPDFDRAIALHTDKLGPEHPAVGAALLQKSTAHLAMGDFEKAKAVLLRAEALLAPHLPVEHPYRLSISVNLARVMLHEGDARGAHEQLTKAFATYEGLAEPCSQERMSIREMLAEAQAALGEPAGALEQYDALAACWTKRPPESVASRPRVQLGRAKATWALGERQRAVALAEQAHASFLALGEAFAADAAAAERWLADHRRGAGTP